MASRAVMLTSLVGHAAAHGGLVNPPARETTAMLWFNEGCQIGCEECQGHVPYPFNLTGPMRICKKDMAPTLDPMLQTWFWDVNPDAFRYMPWNAPGHSPLFSPCGLAAGQSGFHPSNGDVPPPGYKPGFDGRNISGGAVTEWPIGSVQEVSWNIAANHGGGYAVRLCPLASEQTEECFQKHHLPFEGDSTWIQFGEDPTNRTLIRANRTTTGTNPSGSQWTKVPIPACSGFQGGGLTCNGCDAPMFESPIPGLWGMGPGGVNGCAGCKHCGLLHPGCNAEHCSKVMDFQIVDLVKVPNLPAGDYALSFRWDCEQTPQIWSQCANIKIVPEAVV